MSIDTDDDALTFDLTNTPGATNQSVPTRPTNDCFGEILPIVGTAVMGAIRPFRASRPIYGKPPILIKMR
jgi:hypothetical protein